MLSKPSIHWATWHDPVWPSWPENRGEVVKLQFYWVLEGKFELDRRQMQNACGAANAQEMQHKRRPMHATFNFMQIVFFVFLNLTHSVEEFSGNKSPGGVFEEKSTTTFFKYAESISGYHFRISRNSI